MRALAFFSLVLAIVGLDLRQPLLQLVGGHRDQAARTGRLSSCCCRSRHARPHARLAVRGKDCSRFGPLHGDDLAVTFGAGVAVLVVLELLKSLWRGNLSKRISKKSKPKSMPSVLCRRHSRLQGKV